MPRRAVDAVRSICAGAGRGDFRRRRQPRRRVIVLPACAEDDPRFKLIELSRNFGHQIAITAGIDAAAGDAVVVMDADLQDPPEVVADLVAKWREGYEVVYARPHPAGGRKPGSSVDAPVSSTG